MLVAVIVVVIMRMGVGMTLLMQMLMVMGMLMRMGMFMGMLVRMGNTVVGVLMGMLVGVRMGVLAAANVVMMDMHSNPPFFVFSYYTEKTQLCKDFFQAFVD